MKLSALQLPMTWSVRCDRSGKTCLQITFRTFIIQSHKELKQFWDAVVTSQNIERQEFVFIRSFSINVAVCNQHAHYLPPSCCITFGTALYSHDHLMSMHKHFNHFSQQKLELLTSNFVNCDIFSADLRSTIGYWHDNVICLSVCLCLWGCALWPNDTFYLQQKYLK